MRGGEINNEPLNISNSIQEYTLPNAEEIIITGTPEKSLTPKIFKTSNTLTPTAAAIGTKQVATKTILKNNSKTTTKIPNLQKHWLVNVKRLVNVNTKPTNRRFSAPPVLIRNKASRKLLPYGGGKKTRHRRMHKRRITRKHK
jgi:hypothetical protein